MVPNSNYVPPSAVPPPPPGSHPTASQEWTPSPPPSAQSSTIRWLARRLQQMMEDIRERHDHLTIWLRQDIKKTIYIHWDTDEGLRHHRLMNIANRVSVRSSKYTAGSTTFMKTKAKLAYRDATMTETFNYIHTLNENSERFFYHQMQRLESVTQQSQHTREDDNNSTASEVNPNMVWHKTASEPYKNRVYSLKSFFSNNLHTSTLRSSSASTTSQLVDPENSINLREQVLELTRNLHQQAQKSCNSLKRGIKRSSHAC
ncbi:hypothetical protein Ahy_A04g019978 [Arachis hypogaea]|uniref:Uncharacterized protein n=1 Tax=Arachis hypogaea TaxID=3818 RepID=A0A445DGW3_ARAHY|nr:hypothetical protein Ahy_A04g019978 [Arachis hypogaea]